MAGSPLSRGGEGAQAVSRQTLQKAQHFARAVLTPCQENVMTGVLIDHEAGVGYGLVHGLRLFDRGDRRLAGMQDKCWYFNPWAQV
jgi:hypothetical protein